MSLIIDTLLTFNVLNLFFVKKRTDPSAAIPGKAAQREKFTADQDPSQYMIGSTKIYLRFGLKGFYFVLAGLAFFLLTAKETKLPARNFSIQVSERAWTMPSRKIDHAGLRAERRNCGLAL